MPDFREMIRSRLRDCAVEPARQSEIVDEMAQHLADRYDSLRSAGIVDAEAMRTITAELDQRDLAEELRAVERAWVEPVALGSNGNASFWSALWQDLRYGMRVLRMNAGFAAVCIVSLALGIGANTAIFQLIDAIRIRAVPVKHADQLVMIRPIKPDRSGTIVGRFAYMTNAMWEQVRDHPVPALSGVFAFGLHNFNLSEGGQARYARGLFVSGEMFDVLGIQPVVGRLFHASDDHTGCGASGAVLSYPFWQKEFGGDPHIEGKTVSLESHRFPIIGVTPAGFYGLQVGREFDVAILRCSEPVVAGESLYDLKVGWWLTVMGRLKPGVPIEQATAQLTAMSPGSMREALPPEYKGEMRKLFLANQLGAFPAATGISNLRHDYESPLWLLLAISGSVLLIACGNLANLMLARAATRSREIAIRLALGAARGRLIRQLMTESLLLAFSGAVLGILLAGLLSRFLINYLTPTGGTRVFVDLSMDWRVLGFTVAVAVLTCILFGLAPAVKATSMPPAAIISLAGRGISGGRERFSLRRILVVSQIALSLVLVVSALLFSRSLRKILALDAGFQRDGIVVMDVDFTSLKIAPPVRGPFAEELLTRVRAIPGVQMAAEAFLVPLSGSGWNNGVVIDGKVVEGTVLMNSVSGGFFKTLGTPLIAGRDFDERDTATSPRTAIVSEAFAKKYFPGASAVGRTFRIDVYEGQKQVDYEIVGVVGNSKYYDLRDDFAPIAYYPQMQADPPREATEVFIRSNGSLEPLLASLRRVVAEQNPAITIDFHVLATDVRESLLRERLLATLSGFFGILAAILATVGLYGVVAYMVASRTNEIGIRMALGALPSKILAMIVAEAAGLLAIGLAIGIALTMLVGTTVSKLLYGLKPHDPLTLGIAALGLAAIAVTASLLPATRAAHLDPVVALREE